MIVEVGTTGSGMDEHQTCLRGQNGGLTTWHDTEKRRESFLIWSTFDRNFNFRMGKSFNLI